MKDARRRRRGTALIVLGAATAALLVGCTTTEPSPSRPSTPSQSARVFQVDCGAGGGDGDGSRARPWTSIDAVNAHGPFQPGEQVLLRRGSVCRGRLAPTGSGANGDPIVLGAYGHGPAPVVHAVGTPDQTGAVQLTDQHDWVIQDLEVTNSDPAGPDDTLRAGVLVLDTGSGATARIVIRRNTIRRVTSSPAGGSADPHEFGGIAVLVKGATARTGALADIRVEDNLVDQVGRTGIVAWSDAWPRSPLTGVSFTGNRIVQAEGDSIVLWGVDGAVVEHNVSERGGHLPACPLCVNPTTDTASAGIWPVMSKRILIRYNEVFGEGAAGGDGQGFDIDDSTSDVVLQGNYAHDNDGGGVLICGARDSDVRFNVFADSGGGEVTFSCPTQRDEVRIVTNTFLLAPGSSAQVVRHNRTTGSEPVLFANNIVIDENGGGYDWPAPVTAEGNLYAGVVPSSAPADASGVTEPGLVTPGTSGAGLESVRGLSPLPGSAASTGGVPLPAVGAFDYFGRTPMGAPGRGAITAPSGPAALTAVQPTVARSAAGVTLAWSADQGTAWLLQRSTAGRAFTTISGLLTAGPFVDSSPPRGLLRYRLLQVGRNNAGTPSVPVSVKG